MAKYIFGITKKQEECEERERSTSKKVGSATDRVTVVSARVCGSDLQKSDACELKTVGVC
jgi:hypothetical protein